MKKFYWLLFILLLCFSENIHAQWRNVWERDNNSALQGEFLSYYDVNKAYLASEYGIFQHTKDNFKSFQKKIFLLPAQEKLIYFFMYSEKEGVMLTRNRHQVSVYKTTSACNNWTKVYTLPEPVQAPINSFYPEYVYVENIRTTRTLYINFGDIFAYGSVFENNWQHHTYPFVRQQNNSYFRVFNDSIWEFGAGSTALFTPDKGKQWYEEYLPNLGIGGKFSARLSGKTQRFLLHNNTFEELDWASKEWQALPTPTPWAFSPKKILQLSDTTLLVKYWYWPENKDKNAVYNSENKQWIVLDTLSTLMYDFPSSLYEVTLASQNGSQLCGFKWGQLVASNKYGITWYPILDNSLLEPHNVRMDFHTIHIGSKEGIAFGYMNNNVAYCGENSLIWHTLSSESFCKQIQSEFPCNPLFSNKNDGELYVFQKKAYKAEVLHDSLYLKAITLNGLPEEHSILQLLDLQNNGRLCVSFHNQISHLFYYPPLASSPQLLISENGAKNTVLEETRHFYYAVLNNTLFSINKSNLLPTRLFTFQNRAHLTALADDTLIVSTYDNLYRIKGNAILNTWNLINEAPFKDMNRYKEFDLSVDAHNKVFIGSLDQLYELIGENYEWAKADSAYPFPAYARKTIYARNRWWLIEKSVYTKDYYPFPTDNTCSELHLPYPNPFSKQIHLPVFQSKEGEIIGLLININGQKISQTNQVFGKGYYEWTVNTPSDLPSGLYILKITKSCGEIQFFKIIKD